VDLLGLLAKRPFFLAGPLPVMRLLVDNNKRPFRDAAFDLDVSFAAGGVGGLVNLFRFLPNFFLEGVVVAVVAVIVAALLLDVVVLGSSEEVCCKEEAIMAQQANALNS